MKDKVTFFIVLIFICLSGTVDADGDKNMESEGCGLLDPKRVTVAQGTMQGSTLFSGKGRPFCSFRGIPFSQPPVGEYRFQPPREALPWEGILDVTREMPQCISNFPFISLVYGQEDCLYLSVFTPRLKPSSGQLLDVMVWIFPGENYFGFTNTFIFGPHYFMDKDVIIVYVNYRVGVFGFLSTGDDEAPGNYAFKDQSAGIRWVKNNIEAFGGNPNNITLFGHSSGAACCHLQMLSPMSKGLFTRVISLSATALSPWARTDNPLEQAKKQARAVGCTTNSSTGIVSCLRRTDAHTLVASLKYLFLFWIIPSSGYAVVVEKKTERNPNPFLTEDPVELMRTGNFERVPWLMGGVNQEIGVFCVPMFNVQLLRHQINRLFMLPNFLSNVLLLNVSVPPEQAVGVSKNISNFYAGPVIHINGSNELELLNLFSDRLLIHAQHKAAQLHSLTGQTIYKYNIEYRGLYSATMLTSLKNYGVSHSDELMYLFKLGGGILVHPPQHPDLEVRELLLTLLTNFAKFGNPTPDRKTGNDLVDQLDWLPVGLTSLNKMHLRYLNIGQVKVSGIRRKYLDQGFGPVKLKMAVDLYKKRMEFWDSLPLNENCLRNCK